MLDGMDVLREQQESEQPPPIPVEKAPALRNTSDEENEKILNSLGRVAKPDGSNIDYEQGWVRHVAGDLKSSNPILRSSITEFEFQMMGKPFYYAGLAPDVLRNSLIEMRFKIDLFELDYQEEDMRKGLVAVVRK